MGPPGPGIETNAVILNQIDEPQSADFAISGTGRAGLFEHRSTRSATNDPAVDALRVKTEGDTEPRTQFLVRNDGSFVAGGSHGGSCAEFIPASGPGTRFMWHPCRSAVRFGQVPPGGDDWDDVNVGEFSFAGGRNVRSQSYGAFAFGDAVTVTGVVGVGLGSGNTVSGTAGFSVGSSNVCSGFTCTAIGYANTASGQGSVALGYRGNANADYAVALGNRASANGHSGAVVISANSGSSTASAQAAAEILLSGPGGIRLRTSAAGNTGCNLPPNSGVFNCTSTRSAKSGFDKVDGEDLLAKLKRLEITTWRYTADDARSLHLGPVAEDFHAVYGLGEGNRTIGVQDLAGVALAAAQALEHRTAELHARTAELSARTKEVEALRETLQTLEKRLERLERRAAR